MSHCFFSFIMSQDWKHSKNMVLPPLQKLNRVQEIKKSQKWRTKEKKGPSAPNQAMSFDFICMCKSKPNESEKLLQCHSESCENGRFFHRTCLNYKRMPNNSQTTWTCPSCRKKGKVTALKKMMLIMMMWHLFKLCTQGLRNTNLWWALERMSSA